MTSHLTEAAANARRLTSPQAGSVVAEAPGSHSIYLSQPQAVVDLIKRAARGIR